MPIEPPIVKAPPQVAAQPRKSKGSFVLENRLAMFGLLFCVTGFLGLPFLWMSHRFSHTEKIVWSIIVTIYTFILLGLTAAVCWWSYSQISQSLYR